MGSPSEDLTFFYSTQKEIEDAESSKLPKELPSWVEGTFIRTGPGFFDFHGGFTVNHFLDGYALLTRFEIRKSEIKFNSRYLNTESFNKAKVAKKTVTQEFGTKSSSDPTKSMLTRFIPSLIPEMTDNCNVSMFKVQDHLYAAADTCFFREVNVKDLTCGEKYDTSKLFGLNMWSAHPLEDAENKCIYNIGLSFITGLKYNVVQIPISIGKQKDSKAIFKQSKILSSIPSRSTTTVSACHSFGMTESYIIMMEQPAVIVGQRVLASVVHNSCNKDYLDWRPDMKNRFHVIEKRTGRVIKCEYIAETPFFCIHFINCYEIEGKNRDSTMIVVDLIGFPNMNCINIDLKDCRNGNEGTEEDMAKAFRFVIPIYDTSNVSEGTDFIAEAMQELNIKSKAVKKKKQIILEAQVISREGIEVPKVNPKNIGRSYRYFYGGGPRTVGPYRNALCKFDLIEGNELLFRLKDYEYLGEPMFIPNPSGSQEDDGILISAVSVAKKGEKCYLIFIDTKTMKEITRAEFSNFIPMAAHGIFIPRRD